MSTSLFRIAARGKPAAACFRVQPASRTLAGARVSFAGFSTTTSRRHAEETFEEFTSRYEKEFEKVNDSFELQRNLNNCFSYDLVPAPSIIAAALQAARRVNDYPTAVRTFEALKVKVENKNQYEDYLQELKPLREELGIALSEEMFPEGGFDKE